MSTLKIWEEQYRWAQAEARGDDLTLLAQQWRQEELDGIAAGRLSNSDIVEIMDDDCIAIAKRCIKNCTRVINPWLDEVRVAKSYPTESLGWWYCALVGQQAPEKAILRRKALRSVLVAATVKLAQTSGKKMEGYEPITERDVENARAVPIEGLYDWEKPAKISGRFRACCPFHNESTGSFFIFRDNKYRCFGCSCHGDAIDFTMNTMGFDFIESVKYLIKR